MEKKQRLRNTNKSEYKKRKSKKQKEIEFKFVRKVARDNRNYIKKSIIPYYKGYKDSKDIHLLVIIKETNNMERLLLQKIDISAENILLSLPIITSKMISDFLEANNSSTLDDNVLIDIIKHNFDIEVESIERLTEPNVILIKKSNIQNIKENLVVVNARPYDNTVWYKGDITTIEGYKIYGGKAIYNFFQLMQNTSRMYILQHTLTQILLYRTLCNKIDKEEFLADYTLMAKRITLGKALTQFHLTISDSNDKNDYRIYIEYSETEILNEESTI